MNDNAKEIVSIGLGSMELFGGVVLANSGMISGGAIRVIESVTGLCIKNTGDQSRIKDPQEVDAEMVTKAANKAAYASPHMRTFYENIVAKLIDRKYADIDIRKEDVDFLNSMSISDALMVDALGSGGMSQLFASWANTDVARQISSSVRNQRRFSSYTKQRDYLDSYYESDDVVEDDYDESFCVAQDLENSKMVPFDMLCRYIEGRTENSLPFKSSEFLYALKKNDSIFHNVVIYEDLSKLLSESNVFHVYAGSVNSTGIDFKKPFCYAELTEYGERIFKLMSSHI